MSNIVVTNLNGRSADRTTVHTWCNFNGTGTPAITDSENVTSITDHAVGQFTLNFTTALANGDYAVLMSSFKSSSDGGSIQVVYRDTETKSTTGLRVITEVSNGTDYDRDHVMIGIVGGLA